MKVETRSDLVLVTRAVNHGWNITEEHRTEIIESLMEMIRTRDPKLMESAITLMQKLDDVNVKREAIKQRELSNDGDQRLRLVELAQRIPAPELARLASDNGITVDGTAEGRADKATGANGKKAGKRKGHRNLAAGRTKKKT